MPEAKSEGVEKRTSVTRLERLVHHRAHDFVNVGRVRVSGAVVDGGFVRDVVGGMARLVKESMSLKRPGRDRERNTPEGRSTHDACRPLRA